MFEIVLERGGVEIHRFRVSGAMTIGRAAGAQIRLDDPNVDRAHARLLLQDGALLVLDLDSTHGTYLDGRVLRGSARLEPGARLQIGGYTLRHADAARNPALEESTGPDDGAPPAGHELPRLEVLDRDALERALPHVRVGRHFVFVDDAHAVMPPAGRMQRLLGYKHNKGRAVRALADAPVDIAGARIHPAPLELQRLAGLSCDRDLYRAEQDVVRLLVTMPGGGNAVVRVSMNGAPLTERRVELAKGVCVESLAMLLPGRYEAQLVVAGVDTGERARFTVAEYTLAPLSARLLEHRIDRAAQTLTVTLGVESYGVHWDRPLRGALVESGREMSEVVFTMERPGRFTGKARVAGEGPFTVRAAAVDDAARTADVALPGTRRRERQLTLAGELGRELFVSLLPEPGAVAVRGLHVSQGDFVATPVVLEDPVGDRACLRANEDIESLVVAAWDPARDAFSVVDLGDVPRGSSASLDVPRPMCVAFLGCFVNGEPFEAFTALFAAERPVSLEVPDTCPPGGEIAVTVRTGRSAPLPMVLCVRDERLTASDAPQQVLAASARRALSAATAGLGDDFRFVRLEELAAPAAAPPVRTGGTRGGIEVSVRGRGQPARIEHFHDSEVSIGRLPGTQVMLARPNVSKLHARVVLRDGKLVIVDLKSTNGTYVNGKRIGAPQVLKDSDRVTVGDFSLTFAVGAAAAPDDDFDDDVAVLAAPAPRAARAPGVRDEILEDDLFAVSAGDDGLVLDDEEEASTRELRLGDLGSLREKGGGGVEDTPVRAAFPEVLFCGLVEVGDGDVVRVPAGEALGGFAVEIFFVDGGDFGAARARVQVDQAVRVDLDIAPEIDPEDRVQGTLRVGCRSGSARVALVCDGRSVPLKTVDGRIVGVDDALPSGTELLFDAGPGVWLATAAAAVGGDEDAMEVRVGAPGVSRSVAREIVLVDRGKRVTLDGEMLSLRVLPGLDEPFRMLAEATAGYAHLCCEQTAAKILSAVVMFLSADEPALRQRAEEIILAGIARERQMIRRDRDGRGRGFAMYPEEPSVSEHYTPKVVQHLWSLDGLAELNGLSEQLVDAVREGIAMADDVAGACRMARVPERVQTMDDAWALAVRAPRRRREALELVARTVCLDESGPRLRAPARRVDERATLAYAAAVLFASGKTQTAIRLANEVLRQLNEQGRLYSTLDSVAAIALMVQLRRTGIVGGGAELVVNGRTATALEASRLSDQAEVVEVKEGVCVVEVTRVREDRWAEARATFPLKVGFRDGAGRSITGFRRGDRAELVVTLPRGYAEGDLVHVCLPPAMAWLEGGGRVKRFSVDFAGRDEVRIPVVVTQEINGRQRFAVAVRNMFHEERAATPGLMVIESA